MRFFAGGGSSGRFRATSASAACKSQDHLFSRFRRRRLVLKVSLHPPLVKFDTLKTLPFSRVSFLPFVAKIEKNARATLCRESQRTICATRSCRATSAVTKLSATLIGLFIVQNLTRVGRIVHALTYPPHKSTAAEPRTIHRTASKRVNKSNMISS